MNAACSPQEIARTRARRAVLESLDHGLDSWCFTVALAYASLADEHDYREGLVDASVDAIARLIVHIEVQA